MTTRRRARLSLILTACGITALPHAVFAQVVVGAGQTLTRADLLAGQFNGVPFTLGPDLVIDIYAGGTLESLTYSSGYFDFMGTTINVNAGGMVSGGPDSAETTFVTNLNLNIAPEAMVGRMTSRVPRDRVTAMHGGTIGDRLHVHGGGWLGSGDFHMLGGSIGKEVTVSNGLRFTMIDGSIGDGLRVGGFSSFRMSGGEIGDAFRISSYGMVTISGGMVGNMLDVAAVEEAWGGSGFLTISGGTFGNAISVGGYIDDNGEVAAAYLTLNVSSLLIDGVPIELTPNEPWLVTQREGALLEATLADGSYFDLVLNDAIIDGQDYVSQYAVLRAVLVPAPGASAMLGVALAGVCSRRRRCKTMIPDFEKL